MVHKTVTLIIAIFLFISSTAQASTVHIYGNSSVLDPYRRDVNYSGVVGETTSRHHPLMILPYDTTKTMIAQFEVWYDSAAADDEIFSMDVQVAIPSTDGTKQACLRMVYRVTTYGSLWDYNDPGIHNGTNYVDATVNAASSSGLIKTVSFGSLQAIDDYSNVACASESPGTCQGKHGWVSIMRLPNVQCANNVTEPVNIINFDWYFSP